MILLKALKSIIGVEVLVNDLKEIVDRIIGLDIKKAKDIAEEYGIILRSISKGRCHSCDYRSNRVNVEVRDGIVVDFLRIG